MLGERQVSERHIQAMEKMVELRGGPEALGMDGFLGMMVDLRRLKKRH